MKELRLDGALPALDEARLGFFRFGKLPSGRTVLTNDAGEWQVLSAEDFKRFLAGGVAEGEPLWAALQDKGFIRKDADLDALADRVARKKKFLGQGPHLHAMVTTLRCNQSCRYCHASRTDMDRVDTDMSLETAKRAVDFLMQTPSPYVNIEFQGGEPTVRFDVIQFVVGYAKEKNRNEGKRLDFSLVTNMTLMDEEKGRWLLDNGVMVCTSLDGPEPLHNFNRTWKPGSSAHADVLRWMRWFNERYVEMGRDPELWHVDALLTVTNKSFEYWKEIVDLYVELGIRNLHLRPLNPFGFATRTWRSIGYSMAEFMDFYARSLDYILELNKRGVQIQESHAAIFLQKMLTPDDPNFTDIRNPHGHGTGQLAYSFDGRIFTSDEGRMVAGGGDLAFEIGHVERSTWAEVANHPTVKAMTVASTLDTLPGCHTCFNVPFCGVRPDHNYMQARDLFGQRPNTPKCQQHMAISRLLLDKLDSDPDAARIFQRWTVSRPRLES